MVIPPELVDRAQSRIELLVPDDWSREDAARFLRRNGERLRREIERLREQRQLELRGRTYTMEYHHHSR
jgi:predicted metal-dependent hydrolase